MAIFISYVKLPEGSLWGRFPIGRVLGFGLKKIRFNTFPFGDCPCVELKTCTFLIETMGGKGMDRKWICKSSSSSRDSNHGHAAIALLFANKIFNRGLVLRGAVPLILVTCKWVHNPSFLFSGHINILIAL